jgi:thioredoxin 2
MAEPILVVCPHCDKINRLPRERLRDRSNCGICHKPLFESHPLALTDTARFDRHAQKGDLPLVIDFWATWCGPCLKMAPIFEQAAAQLEPEFRLVKVDTDAAPELSARYAIESIPTLMIIHHGQVVARTAGAMPLPQLLAWIRQNAAGIAA